jgi:hypothetical protein
MPSAAPSAPIGSVSEEVSPEANNSPTPEASINTFGSIIDGDQEDTAGQLASMKRTWPSRHVSADIDECLLAIQTWTEADRTDEKTPEDLERARCIFHRNRALTPA